jgi:hypothetical protein
MSDVFSPQVVTSETDLSSVAPAVSSSIAAIVGPAVKGELDVPQYITTPNQFIEVFGNPIADQPYLGLTAINFLRKGNQLWVNRVASIGGTDPVATATVSTAASITTTTVIPSFGFSETLQIQMDSTVVNVVFIPATSTDLATMVTTINNKFLTYATRLGTAEVVNTDKIKITTQTRNGELSTIQVLAAPNQLAPFSGLSGAGTRTVKVAEALAAATLTSLSNATLNTVVTPARVNGNLVTTGTKYNVSKLGQNAYGKIDITGTSIIPGTYQSAQVSFTGIPVAGQTIIINRADVAVPNTATFVWVVGAPATTLEIELGGTTAACAENFATAMNAYVTAQASTTLTYNNGAPYFAKFPDHGVRASWTATSSIVTLTQINPLITAGNKVTISGNSATTLVTPVVAAALLLTGGPSDLDGGVAGDYFWATVPAIAGVAYEEQSDYFLLADADFLATGTINAIAASVAGAINNVDKYDETKLLALTGASINNQVTISTPTAVIGSEGNSAAFQLVNASGGINFISVADLRVIGTVAATLGGALQHGFDARGTYAFGAITVDGVTKSMTDFSFDTLSAVAMPTKFEATLQEVVNAINATFGYNVASVMISGANEALLIGSSESGNEGTVSVAVSVNLGGYNDPLAVPGAWSKYDGAGGSAQAYTPGNDSVGTGDNHLVVAVDNTFSVDVFLSQDSALTLAEAIIDINAAANAVDTTLATLATVSGSTIILTSPTLGSLSSFGSQIRIDNGITGFFTTNAAADGTGGIIYPLTITAVSPGTWANSVVEVIFSDEDAQFHPVNSSKVDVLSGGIIVETYRDVVVNPLADGTDGSTGQGVFIETAINGVSEYITVDFDEDRVNDTDANTFATSTKIVKNTGRTGSLPPYILTGGANGLNGLGNAEVIGVVNADGSATGIQNFADTEKIFINLLAAPAFTSESIGNALVTLAESRQDTLAIIDPPLGLKTQDMVDWHNGQGGLGRTAALNTSYAATYNTWIKQYDPYNDQDVWMPPSSFVLAQMAYSDSVSDPWFATAGLNRGKLTDALDVRYNAGLGDRELLYGQGNRVNPIPKFVKEGIVLWGNSTLLRTESALSEITVRRLMNYAKVVIGLGSKIVLFEPNDPTAIDQLLNIVNPVLHDIQVRRGLTSFTVRDATTDRDRNLRRAVIKIFMQPTRTLEVIEIPFVVVANGGNFAI